jgi:hypothetical protein
MKKAYAAPTAKISGEVVANTMKPGSTPSEDIGLSVAGAMGFYL